MTDDRELVRLMLAGNERAFSEFFATYFPRSIPLRAAAAEPQRGHGQGRRPDDPDQGDAQPRQFRGEAAMFTWLCQICRREVADQVRSQRRHSGKVVLIEDSEEVRLALESIEAPAADDPLRRYDGAELKRLVHAVLDRLPGRYGEALEWKYVEGRSVEEIGDLLGIGHTAAQSLLRTRAGGVSGRSRGRVRRVCRRRAREPRDLTVETNMHDETTPGRPGRRRPCPPARGHRHARPAVGPGAGRSTRCRRGRMEEIGRRATGNGGSTRTGRPPLV